MMAAVVRNPSSVLDRMCDLIRIRRALSLFYHNRHSHLCGPRLPLPFTPNAFFYTSTQQNDSAVMMQMDCANFFNVKPSFVVSSKCPFFPHASRFSLLGFPGPPLNTVGACGMFTQTSHTWPSTYRYTMASFFPLSSILHKMQVIDPSFAQEKKGKEGMDRRAVSFVHATAASAQFFRERFLFLVCHAEGAGEAWRGGCD